jgi:phosphoribosylformylglycinamidine synthase
LKKHGGLIDLDKLPVGDPTLSAKEIIGNESQERMGLVIGEKIWTSYKRIADRERSPMYEVGVVTNDHRFTFPIENYRFKTYGLRFGRLFGSSPKPL